MFHPILLVGLLYFLLKKLTRRSRRFYRSYINAYRFLDDLARRRGGKVIETGYRRVTYRPPTSNAFIDIDCSSWPRLNVQLQQEFPFSVSLFRVPRLIYAFTEAFISPPLRFDGLPYFPVGNGQQSVQDLKSKQGIMNVLTEVNELGFSARITESDIALKKKFRNRDLNEENLFRMITVVEDLARICGKPAISIPLHSLESENRCAYCREMIHPEDSVIHCSVCKTPHHSDCFALNGKCAVFGCNSSRPVERSPVPVLN